MRWAPAVRGSARRARGPEGRGAGTWSVVAGNGKLRQGAGWSGEARTCNGVGLEMRRDMVRHGYPSLDVLD